jgi:hypothetical protein
MMRAGDLLGHPEHLRSAVREHAGTEHGMRLDDLELLGLQSAGLEQDRVRDRDLAEVVQRRGLADQPDHAVALIQPARHPRRQRGDALGVLGRVVVPVLGRAREPLERVDADRLDVAERAQRLARDDRLQLAEADAHGAVVEHDPQPAHARRAEGLAVANEVGQRHHGRPGVEPERVQACTHGGGIGVAEADDDLRLRGRCLRRHELERRHEIDRGAARGGQQCAKRLRCVAVPADNKDTGAGESVVIHT